MVDLRDKLDYYSLRNTKIFETDRGFYYFAIPSKKKNEKYVKVFVEWDSKEWSARVEGLSRERSGYEYFSRDYVKLNRDACKKACEFISRSCDYYFDDNFIEVFSRLSPFELKAILDKKDVLVAE